MVNQATLVTPGSLIRRLGSLEELIWLRERRASRTIVLLAEVQGSTTPEDWRTALNRVQARHTILSSRICKDPGSRPYFELARGVELPLEVVPLDSGPSALERCSRELGTNFPQGHMLMRATVLHDRARSTLILAVDHAAFDGRSLVFIVRDLLRSLAGESLGDPQPISPSQDEFFGLHNQERYTEVGRSDRSHFRSTCSRLGKASCAGAGLDRATRHIVNRATSTPGANYRARCPYRCNPACRARTIPTMEGYTHPLRESYRQPGNAQCRREPRPFDHYSIHGTATNVFVWLLGSGKAG